jgi:hypothetical protein
LRSMHFRVRIAAVLVLAGCGARTFAAEDGDTGDECSLESEVCDGIDNDCDGAVDEDIASVTCGVGSCQTTVVCEDGEMAECVPEDPVAEACNLADDDCDGEVDEGFGFGPVGETIVLRSNEFSTGSCTSCSWAWGTTLAPTSDGFLAVWNLGISGGNRNANIFGRFVDGAGIPTGPVELLRDDFVTNMYPMQALPPMPAAGLPLAIGHRTPGQADVSGLLFAGTDGRTQIVSPIPGNAPNNVESILWTGQAFVTAWEQDDELRVAVLAEDGSVQSMVDVDPLERPGAITLGVYPGRVGILVSRVRVELELWDQWFVLLDSFGNVLTPAHEIDVEYTAWQQVVGTEEGWLHIRANDFDEPSTRQPLDAEGIPLDVALPFADGRHISDSGLSDTFVPRPGLHEMITAWTEPDDGTMHVEFLDDRGDSLRGWSGELEPDPDFDSGYLVEPYIQILGGRVFVIWHGLAGDEQPNTVYLRAFGCAP